MSVNCHWSVYYDITISSANPQQHKDLKLHHVTPMSLLGHEWWATCGQIVLTGSPLTTDDAGHKYHPTTAFMWWQRYFYESCRLENMYARLEQSLGTQIFIVNLTPQGSAFSRQRLERCSTSSTPDKMSGSCTGLCLTCVEQRYMPCQLLWMLEWYGWSFLLVSKLTKSNNKYSDGWSPSNQLYRGKLSSQKFSLPPIKTSSFSMLSPVVTYNW